MKFIKITLYKSKEELVEIFDKASKILTARLFDIENQIKHVTIHQEPCVIFMTPTAHQELEVLNLYKSLGLDIKLEDLSQEAIFSFYHTKDLDVIDANIKEWQFKELLQNYIRVNSDSDQVLDKINLHGIGSLTEADKQFFK